MPKTETYPNTNGNNSETSPSQYRKHVEIGLKSKSSSEKQNSKSFSSYTPFSDDTQHRINEKSSVEAMEMLMLDFRNAVFSRVQCREYGRDSARLVSDLPDDEL